MRRIQFWLLCGVPALGLLAALVGPSVMGQPDGRPAFPPSAPRAAQPDVLKRPNVPGPMPEFPPSLPTSKPIAPTTVITQPLPPFATQAPPSLLTDKLERPALTKESVSLNVAPGKQQPSVQVEWSGPPNIRINKPTAAQILIKNPSTTPAQNVIVRHRLAPGVTCKASDPQAVNDGGELVWHLGTLAPDQTRRIDIQFVAQTHGQLNCHAVVTFTSVAAHQVHVREPQLVVKMRAPERVIVGENITLLFTISNPGDGVSELVKLKATLPDGLEHPRGKVIDIEVGSLAPKEVRTTQLVCQVKGQGTQKCFVVASGDGNLSSSDHCQTEILTPKLNVTMSGPKLRYLDRHAVYVLKVTNPGSAAATNVEVHELIPAGFKFHQANCGGQFQDATRLVSWNIGELQPGQSKEVAVDVVPIETGEHRLIAHAKGARGLKSEAEMRTQVEGLPALAIEVGHVDDPIEVGAETTFEIRVVNTGTKTATNVQVVCTLPEQLEFKGASQTLRHRLEGREVVFEPLARLAPKADMIYRVQVRGVAAGDVRFRMRIRADGLKEAVLREQSMRIYSDESSSVPISAPVGLPPVSMPAAPSAPVGLPPVSTPIPAPAPVGLPPIPRPAVSLPPVSMPVAPAGTPGWISESTPMPR